MTRCWSVLMLILLISASSSRVIDELVEEEEEEEEEVELLCSEISCKDYECPEVEICEFGFVPDVCECCYACAKGPGEQCGGMFDLAGTCSLGYDCEPHPKYTQLPGICIEGSTEAP